MHIIVFSHTDLKDMNNQKAHSQNPLTENQFEFFSPAPASGHAC